MTSTFESLKTLFQRGYLRQIGTPVLFAAVVLLLSGVLLLSANVAALRKSSAFVDRTNHTLLQIAEVDARLVGVEMTVRGYALTDDPAFLEYQNNERARLKIAMDKLAPLIADEASQTSGFSRLQVVVAKRLALYAYLSGLGPGHAKAVAAAITDKAKRRGMIEARATLNAMRDRQLQFLAERQATASLQAGRTYELAIGIVVLAFVFSALGFAFALYGRSAQRDLARGS
jgi:CHASE3 domain sensor protein